MLILTTEGLEDDGPIGDNLGGAYLFFFSFHSSTPRLLVICWGAGLCFEVSWDICPWFGNTFFGGLGKFDIQLVLYKYIDTYLDKTISK